MDKINAIISLIAVIEEIETIAKGNVSRDNVIDRVDLHLEEDKKENYSHRKFKWEYKKNKGIYIFLSN